MLSGQLLHAGSGIILLLCAHAELQASCMPACLRCCSQVLTGVCSLQGTVWLGLRAHPLLGSSLSTAPSNLQRPLSSVLPCLAWQAR